MWMVCGQLLDVENRGLDWRSLRELVDLRIEGRLYEIGDDSQQLAVGLAGTMTYRLLRTRPVTAWSAPRHGVACCARTMAGVRAPEESDRRDPAPPWAAPGVTGLATEDTVAVVALMFAHTREVALLGATAPAQHDPVLDCLLDWAKWTYQLGSRLVRGRTKHA